MTDDNEAGDEIDRAIYYELKVDNILKIVYWTILSLAYLDKR